MSQTIFSPIQWPSGWRYSFCEIDEDDQSNPMCIRLHLTTHLGQVDLVLLDLWHLDWDNGQEDACERLETSALESVCHEHLSPALDTLPSGSYWLNWDEASSRWQASLDSLHEIPDSRPITVAEPIPLTEIPDYTRLPLYRAHELNIHRIGAGLATAAPNGHLGTPPYFLKYNSRKPLENFFSELSALRRFSHPSIIKLLGLLVDSDNNVIGIVLPNAEHGTLDGQTEATIQHKIQWISEIIDAMIYLKTFDAPYTDLKCSNVVVDSNLKAILVDFDGGHTLGKNQKNSESFALAVMLEEMGYSGELLKRFVEGAKTGHWTLEKCRESIRNILSVVHGISDSCSLPSRHRSDLCGSA
ncbi:hypothetical protein CALVIDRAFT_542241 [Calocera viscosa TUFC12733]|uniref:Protein kinase domain-containing protein n=1 Tax=Calocera viscosa (strain TUFC12733) TaxID=1330018 RepID=A0A167GWE8_CALVF|nr:hypothetical protein CALVIDRAFT_542241 [Calocera viscosa TUFC12733]